MPASKTLLNHGFTLIELVMGITVFAVVLTLVTSVMAPQAVRSVDPIFQVRASEFAQSLLSEIVAKSFDENSDRSGGTLRCGEDKDGDGVSGTDGDGSDMCACPSSAPSCGSDHTIGADEAQRKDYDDVDDYHGLSQSGSALTDSQGETLEDAEGNPLYAGYSADVAVFYDADYNGIADNAIGLTKGIRVEVTTPAGQTLQFMAYRGNY